MSEYQYYEWQTISRMLSAGERSQIEGLSTHMGVTPTSAAVSYNWGDFKYDPVQVLADFFDVFLCMANWGTRWLAFRLPAEQMTAEMIGQIEQYLWEDSVRLLRIEEPACWVLTIELEDEEGAGWIEGGGRLSKIAVLRDNILAGDYRALYLAWLAAMQLEYCEDEATEPPVPPGLNELTPALKEFARFFDLHPALVAAAGRSSVPLPPPDAPLDDVVTRLPRAEADAWLLRALRGETGVQAGLRRRLVELRNALAQKAAPPRRTWRELETIAESKPAPAQTGAPQPPAAQKVAPQATPQVETQRQSVVPQTAGSQPVVAQAAVPQAAAPQPIGDDKKEADAPKKRRSRGGRRRKPKDTTMAVQPVEAGSGAQSPAEQAAAMPSPAAPPAVETAYTLTDEAIERALAGQLTGPEPLAAPLAKEEAAAPKKRRSRGGRKHKPAATPIATMGVEEQEVAAGAMTDEEAALTESATSVEVVVEETATESAGETGANVAAAKKRRSRGGRKRKPVAIAPEAEIGGLTEVEAAPVEPVGAETVVEEPVAEELVFEEAAQVEAENQPGQPAIPDLPSASEASWDEVEAYVARKNARAYDAAVTLLVQLRDEATAANRLPAFEARLAELQARSANRPAFLERLRHALA
jgi:hypothetical protein